jgi:hypothetical protein
MPTWHQLVATDERHGVNLTSKRCHLLQFLLGGLRHICFYCSVAPPGVDVC